MEYTAFDRQDVRLTGEDRTGTEVAWMRIGAFSLMDDVVGNALLLVGHNCP